MYRWCKQDFNRTVTQGNYSEARIITLTSREFHDEPAFMAELASRVMRQYEGPPAPRTLILPQSLISDPKRTRAFYRKIFDITGEYTGDFVTEASETLAVWVEESLEAAVYAEKGMPHNNEPAYDILSILQDEDGRYFLRIIQVKATKAQLQANCSDAVRKFGMLEEGFFDPQLSARLEWMLEKRKAPQGVFAGDLLFSRRYRVTVIHSEPRSSVQIMTVFDQSVPGSIERRSARLIEIRWDGFWRDLAKRIYEQLA